MIKNGFWLFLVAFVILILFLPSFAMMQELKEKNVQYERQIYELAQKNRELKEERRRLIEDPVYLEKVAREKMGIIKQGEVVYRLKPEADSDK